MTTQKQIRASFWQAHPHLETFALMWGIKTAPYNRHNDETRMAFIHYLDHLEKSGEITDELAFRATL
jgi:hypothetical protein